MSEESTIYAIDKNIASFHKNTSFKGATIKLLELDFEKETLPLFLDKMKSCLNGNACFLIVEYDTEVPNHWVPYPVSFLSLKKIFSDLLLLTEEIYIRQ